MQYKFYFVALASLTLTIVAQTGLNLVQSSCFSLSSPRVTVKSHQAQLRLLFSIVGL